MDFLRRYEPLYGADHFVRGTLVVIAPHPDDETIGVGGLIAAHRSRGVPVHVIVMTDGSSGIPGEKATADYCALREAETRAASKALGGFELRFLGFEDGALASSLGVVDSLSKALVDINPKTLVFPSPLEVHPDHRAASLAALRASAVLGGSARLLAYEIGAMMPANVLLDITPWQSQKHEAIRAYASQLAHMDICGKVAGLNRARTVNVSDPQVLAAEAFADIAPKDVVNYLTFMDQLARLLDGSLPT